MDVGNYVENMGNPTPLFRTWIRGCWSSSRACPPRAWASCRRPAAALRLDALPGKTFDGKVSFINPAADEASRTVKVKAEVSGTTPPASSSPACSWWARRITGRRTGVLVVPRAALSRGSRRPHRRGVRRPGRDREAQGAPDRRGPRRDAVEIVDGLKAGEEVVTRGGFNLRDGDAVRSTQGPERVMFLSDLSISGRSSRPSSCWPWWCSASSRTGARHRHVPGHRDPGDHRGHDLPRGLAETVEAR